MLLWHVSVSLQVAFTFESPGSKALVLKPHLCADGAGALRVPAV